jgi:hypothetical protein
MNTNQNKKNLSSISRQARRLVSQSRLNQSNRQDSMLRRASDEIGLNK